MDTRYKLFIVRWSNRTYSIYFGTGKYRMIEILDEIGDPGAAEAREIPPRFAGFFCINQPMPDGKLELEGCEYFVTLDELWDACTKRLWPEDPADIPVLEPAEDSNETDQKA